MPPKEDNKNNNQTKKDNNAKKPINDKQQPSKRKPVEEIRHRCKRCVVIIVAAIVLVLFIFGSLIFKRRNCSSNRMAGAAMDNSMVNIRQNLTMINDTIHLLEEQQKKYHQYRSDFDDYILQYKRLYDDIEMEKDIATMRDRIDKYEQQRAMLNGLNVSEKQRKEMDYLSEKINKYRMIKEAYAIIIDIDALPYKVLNPHETVHNITQRIINKHRNGHTANGNLNMNSECIDNSMNDIDNAMDTESDYAQQPYNDIPYNNMPYDNASYNGMLYDNASYNGMPYDNASYNDASYDNMQYNDASYNDASYNDASYNNMPYNDASYNNESHDAMYDNNDEYNTFNDGYNNNGDEYNTVDESAQQSMPLNDMPDNAHNNDKHVRFAGFPTSSPTPRQDGDTVRKLNRNIDDMSNIEHVNDMQENHSLNIS